MITRMEFQEVVRRRRMVRTYSSEPVDPAVVDHLLANAACAPSAGHSQGWGFLVLDTPADLERFWRSTTPPGADPDSRWLRSMRTAPVVVVPHSNEQAYRDRYALADKNGVGSDGLPWSVPYWHVDTGMASLLLLQSAVDAGLGACFFGIPAETTDELRREFDVPSAFTPIGAITLGHPAAEELLPGSAARRARRPMAEVVHRGGWRVDAPG